MRALLLAALLASGAHAAPFANIDISRTGPEVAAAVPMIALDPANPRRIAIAWRTFSIPLRNNVPAAGGVGICHLSLSDDGGASFRDTAPPLTAPEEFCNAPWAAFAGKAVILGATITGRPVPPGTPRSGKTLVGLVRSTDGGRTWAPRVAPISAADPASRFVVHAGIDAAKLHSGTDGARGVHDATTGTLFVSGAHPAPPDSADHSQRFVTGSADGGRTFGLIYAFDSAEWPGRWDGDLAASRGTLALSYVAGAEPGGAVCPCAVLGLSRDGGRTVARSLVAPASDFSMADLVHVPVVAADPSNPSRFAIGLIGADNASARIYVTTDSGGHWAARLPAQPAGIVKVTRIGVAFAADGTLIATWRGTRVDGSYDLFAAAAGKAGFAAPLRISTASSTRPATVPATGFEGGDFTSWVSADARAAHFAWADARDGKSVRTFYAHVPLKLLKEAKP